MPPSKRAFRARTRASAKPPSPHSVRTICLSEIAIFPLVTPKFPLHGCLLSRKCTTMQSIHAQKIHVFSRALCWILPPCAFFSRTGIAVKSSNNSTTMRLIGSAKTGDHQSSVFALILNLACIAAAGADKSSVESDGVDRIRRAALRAAFSVCTECRLRFSLEMLPQVYASHVGKFPKRVYSTRSGSRTFKHVSSNSRISRLDFYIVLSSLSLALSR